MLIWITSLELHRPAAAMADGRVHSSIAQHPSLGFVGKIRIRQQFATFLSYLGLSGGQRRQEENDGADAESVQHESVSWGSSRHLLRRRHFWVEFYTTRLTLVDAAGRVF